MLKPENTLHNKRITLFILKIYKTDKEQIRVLIIVKAQIRNFIRRTTLVHAGIKTLIISIY